MGDSGSHGKGLTGTSSASRLWELSLHIAGGLSFRGSWEVFGRVGSGSFFSAHCCEILFFLVALSAVITGSLCGQVFSVPRSDEVAQLEITLPTGAKAKVEVRDGTMATVQDEKTGYMYGFVIAIGTSSNQITVTSIAITDDGKHVTQFHGSDEDSITPGASLLITAKYTTAAKKELTLPFNLYLMDISPGQFPNVRPLRQPLKSLSPDQLKTIFGKVGGGSCCVSCYGITVCAGRVDLDCGSCGSGGGFLAN